MIYGQKGYDNRSKYFYTQTNNAIEKIFSRAWKPYLETCGPSSAVMGCLLMMKNLDYINIISHGGWKCQPEDYLTLWFNDFRNTEKMQQVRKLSLDKIPGNRVPQYYPLAVKEVFDIDSKFTWIKNVDEIKRELRLNNCVQVCLKKPGHYNIIVAYDDITDEFIFNDPWPGRKGLRNGGFNERIKADKLYKNLQKFMIVYYNQRG